jgi:hypothetical protein
MAGKMSRQQFAAKMQQMAREHEHKEVAQASAENRFASEQARLRQAFLERSRSQPAASLR